LVKAILVRENLTWDFVSRISITIGQCHFHRSGFKISDQVQGQGAGRSRKRSIHGYVSIYRRSATQPLGLRWDFETTSKEKKGTEMIIIMNSSKTMDFGKPACISKSSLPDFRDDSDILVRKLRRLSVKDFSKLMGVSEKLALMNVARYKRWRVSPPESASKQALLAFKGDIYSAMDV
jgi:hypothetical protein